MVNGKKIIGILGAVGSGKSTAARLFGELGCAVIDADRIAHAMLDTEEVKQELAAEFGNGIFDEQGEVDRKSLGDKVFNDPQKVQAINAIIHPRVMEEVETRIADRSRKEEVRAIVLDIPLLAEVGWHERCDSLVFVKCDEKIRRDRTHKRHGGRDIEAKKREKFQISLDKKAKIADYILVNNSEVSALADQVQRVFTGIIN
ncbi:Dephospho-CoA kinase [Anaerohalosphaera lusitana]|uniref:Dephospho-CoA kinase n=1 Tax=Anaerohalosphaera lusitana TaxID=1936003 RepID=A0A1U9NPF0_9BACT|nr:dephospho-CoA kinase [Anaerohalosphaera lusitana]AQT69715.1 Dephospho-CoA kinase [Anaerohalosphaera lusitana]